MTNHGTETPDRPHGYSSLRARASKNESAASRPEPHTTSLNGDPHVPQGVHRGRKAESRDSPEEPCPCPRSPPACNKDAKPPFHWKNSLCVSLMSTRLYVQYPVNPGPASRRPSSGIPIRTLLLKIHSPHQETPQPSTDCPDPVLRLLDIPCIIIIRKSLRTIKEGTRCSGVNRS